jgi:TPR repeat protein
VGLARAEEGDVEGARPALIHVVESWDAELAPRAAVILGDLEEAGGRRATAEHLYRQAMASGHPRHAPVAAVNLGLLLAAGDGEGADEGGTDHGETVTACLTYAMCSDHEEASPWAALTLGGVLAGTGDLEGALRAYRRAVESGHVDAAPSAARELEQLEAVVGR